MYITRKYSRRAILWQWYTFPPEQVYAGHTTMTNKYIFHE